jgi:hypothetical protein
VPCGAREERRQAVRHVRITALAPELTKLVRPTAASLRVLRATRCALVRRWPQSPAAVRRRRGAPGQPRFTAASSPRIQFRKTDPYLRAQARVQAHSGLEWHHQRLAAGLCCLPILGANGTPASMPKAHPAGILLHIHQVAVNQALGCARRGDAQGELLAASTSAVRGLHWHLNRCSRHCCAHNDGAAPRSRRSHRPRRAERARMKHGGRCSCLTECVDREGRVTGQWAGVHHRCSDLK